MSRLPTTAACLLGILLALPGCGSLPPLDDATLLDVSLASSSDLGRYQEARINSARENFGGASIKVGENSRVTYSPEQFDEYFEAEGESALPPNRHPNGWPTLILTLESSRVLTRRNDLGSVEIFFCDKENSSQRLGPVEQLLWSGQFATSDRTPEMRAALKNGDSPLRYQALFGYNHLDRELINGRGQLLPLPDDLCVSRIQYGMFHPPHRGKPLRISNDVVNEALKPVLKTRQEQ